VRVIRMARHGVDSSVLCQAKQEDVLTVLRCGMS
jgi:hypothetical protein